MSKEEVSQKLVDSLEAAAGHTIVSSVEWAATHSFKHDLVVGCLKSLAASEVVVLGKSSSTEKGISADGKKVLAEGSPEYKLWSLLPKEGETSKTALAESLGGPKVLGKIMGEAMKLKWITVRKDAKEQYVSRKEANATDGVKALVQQVSDGKELDKKVWDTLKKRKFVAVVTVTTWKVEKGPLFSTDKWNVKAETELTSDMLASGSWKDTPFKNVNLNSLGAEPGGGHLHPLMKVRTVFRQLFLELGYEEMPTNNFVESSFWNFDVLFQPQSHPARDAHDTFFLKEPASTLSIPADYMARVKEMHEKGGHGSYGWRYDWEESEARKNILRTHTTAVSSRMLYKIGQQEVFTPKKYFSIDRVFRNETLDATHLAEFHQIEGLIADYDLTLAHLIGAVKQFFARIGIVDLRFKPAYNPYTEPSMEIFGYHPTLKKWVELGNSGMFRPEMLMPMGLPEGVRVIAWGLSVERPTMIKYAIGNIRDLLGHKVDIPFIHRSPIARFNPEEEKDETKETE
eukprot:TRINITY_DN4420_c0_g1_i1.p1 TRINITY_DN4420_c0_g1~~TRINITY_DN4420_c0_g1_i1.p1  ORF type:complete len:514 (+),score=162.55 TRINITY_DN4420_c0_g1_i1:38-1579(+)